MTCTAAMQRSNAAVRSSFKNTVAGAFRALGHDIIQLSRQHLSRRRVLPVSSTHLAVIHNRWSVIGLADFRGALPLAATALTDLPACILNHIASFVDTKSRLPLFRTSKLLRDAILGHVAVDGIAQLTTCLRIQADIMLSLQQQKTPQDALSGEQASESLCHDNIHGLSAHAASRLLELAAQPAHDVHLTVQAFLPMGWTSQKMSWGMSKEGVDGNTSDPNSRHMMARYNAADWLVRVFKPWISKKPGAPLLRCVTKICFTDIALDHPMPIYIGHACPALQSYGLHNVVWPVHAGKIRGRSWPHVEELLLSDVCHQHLAHMLNPVSLPKLSRMRLAWSYAYASSQFTLHKYSTAALSLCAKGFRRQLTTLEVDGLAWFMISPCDEVHDLSAVTPHDSSNVFTVLKSLSISHPPPLTNFQVTYGSMLSFLVRCTPNLQRLHLDTLHLNRDYTRVPIQWPHLQHLQVDAFETDMFSTLACMPRMPRLRKVTVPKGACTLHVDVGVDWVVDVIKAMTEPVATELETQATEQFNGNALHIALLKGIDIFQASCMRFCCKCLSVAVRVLTRQQERTL